MYAVTASSSTTPSDGLFDAVGTGVDVDAGEIEKVLLGEGVAGQSTQRLNAPEVTYVKQDAQEQQK